MEDIRYEWKSGKKGDGIEVVSERIAQFELLEVKKDSGAQSNSKGEKLNFILNKLHASQITKHY